MSPSDSETSVEVPSTPQPSAATTETADEVEAGQRREERSRARLELEQEAGRCWDVRGRARLELEQLAGRRAPVHDAGAARDGQLA